MKGTHKCGHFFAPCCAFLPHLLWLRLFLLCSSMSFLPSLFRARTCRWLWPSAIIVGFPSWDSSFCPNCLTLFGWGLQLSLTLLLGPGSSLLVCLWFLCSLCYFISLSLDQGPLCALAACPLPPEGPWGPLPVPLWVTDAFLLEWVAYAAWKKLIWFFKNWLRARVCECQHKWSHSVWVCKCVPEESKWSQGLSTQLKSTACAWW